MGGLPFKQLLDFETVTDKVLINTVDTIIVDVRKGGDSHVLKLTQQFDQHPAQDFKDLCLDQIELKKAFDELKADIKSALTFAAGRIESFHKA